MIFMIIFILSVLVVINFVLLKFSCNKTTRRQEANKPFVVKRNATALTTRSAPTRLAATGS